MTMRDAALETVLRRDRTLVVAALVWLIALAWAYLLWSARGMQMESMPMSASGVAGAGTMAAMPGATHAWSPAEFCLVFAMWAVMMVAMMLPSATPAILMYARVGRQAECRGKPFAATGCFVAGYLLAWTGFSLAATVGQWLLGRALLVDPMMASTSHALSGLLLVAAGAFQWTPLKHACLAQCQAPLQFIHRHGGFRGTPRGALAIGLRHGVYCIGCCWALMALLFVGGVMNILWIALISAFVLLEKVFIRQAWLPRAAGVALVSTGLWVLGTAV